MDIETVRKIWEIESGISGRDSMARAAVKASDFEFMALLHDNLGPEAFMGNAEKDPTDAIITAARLGRLDELKWMLAKGIETRYEESATGSRTTYICPAIKGACNNGRSECLHVLLEHFDMYSKGYGCGDFDYRSIDPMNLHIKAMAVMAANGGDISRGVEIYSGLLESLNYKPGWIETCQALQSGLHEILPAMLKRGGRLNISKLSGASDDYLSSGLKEDPARHEACWRVIAQYCEENGLGFDDVFCLQEVVRSRQTGAVPASGVDYCFAMIKSASGVAYVGGHSSDGACIALIDLLHGLDEKFVHPEAVKYAIMANRPAILKRLMDLDVGFRVEYMGSLSDPECARILHRKGFNLGETWLQSGYSSYPGRHTRTECSVLSNALSRGTHTELALLQVLYEAGVDFSARVNDRTMAQYAAKADDAVKRFMKACKTGMTIESAFDGGASDAQPAPKNEDFGNIL
mgnify:CR=1 FL=1